MKSRDPVVLKSITSITKMLVGKTTNDKLCKVMDVLTKFMKLSNFVTVLVGLQ